MRKSIIKIPKWALKAQSYVISIKSKFRIGDIVLVDNSNFPSRSHFDNGIGVITEIGEDGGYSIGFGPRKGESAWYPDETLTLLKRVKDLS
jgi:hypothetical protein